MALSGEVQKLVDAKKWSEAYDIASNDRTATDDASFLVWVEDSSSGKEGYLKGDATSYSLVPNAGDASASQEKDANKLAAKIRGKGIETSLVKRSDVIQDVGSRGTERGAVIELFIKERFPKIDFNAINDIVTKWIEELGFSYNTNPFLKFMDEYIKKQGAIDGNTLEIINDLYSNDEVTTSELQAKTTEGINHIIFDKNLYGFGYEDAEFIVQSYKWLSDPLHIRNYMTNVDAITKYGIADVRTLDNRKASEIRDKIIFADSVGGAINAVADIQRELRYFQAGGDKMTSDANRETSIRVGRQVNNEAKWKNLLSKEALTAQDAQDLLNYVAKEFKLA